MYVINTLAPVFLVIALGALLRRSGLLSAELVGGITRLAYWVGLPALLFYKIATAPQIDFAAGGAFVIILIGTLACIGASYALAALLGTGGKQTGAFVQAAFRGNLTYVGLAVIFNAFSQSGDDAVTQSAQTTAILALAPIVVFYNITAVTVLLAGQHRMNLSAVGKILRGIVTNPILLACVGGIVYSRAGWKLPIFAERTLGVVGPFALPAALLGIGGTLVAAKIRGRVLYSLLAAIIKVGVAPAVGALAAMLLGATHLETTVAMIMLSCPTATASYVLAGQLGGDETLTAAAIVLSVLFSIVPLAIAVSLI